MCMTGSTKGNVPSTGQIVSRPGVVLQKAIVEHEANRRDHPGSIRATASLAQLLRIGLFRQYRGVIPAPCRTLRFDQSRRQQRVSLRCPPHVLAHVPAPLSLDCRSKPIYVTYNWGLARRLAWQGVCIIIPHSRLGNYPAFRLLLTGTRSTSIGHSRSTTWPPRQRRGRSKPTSSLPSRYAPRKSTSSTSNSPIPSISTARSSRPTGTSRAETSCSFTCCSIPWPKACSVSST